MGKQLEQSGNSATRTSSCPYRAWPQSSPCSAACAGDDDDLVESVDEVLLSAFYFLTSDFISRRPLSHNFRLPGMRLAALGVGYSAVLDKPV